MRSTKAATAVSASVMKTLAICLFFTLNGCALKVAVVGAGTADLVSTRMAIQSGQGREANHLMGQGAVRQAITKAVGISGVLGATALLEHKGKKTLARVIQAAAVIVWSAAAIHNGGVRR